MEKKVKIFTAFIVLIIAIISILGIFSYLVFFEEEKNIDKTVEAKIIDDRISPYANQGLTVEIQRIRNRGLLEKILNFGLSWRKIPTFYWVCIVDGKEHNLANIEAAGGVTGTGAFTDWDTFGKESKANFFIEEEQESSEITITIIEVVKSGLFGRRTSNVEKEKINLIFDYRTGHWTGDDYLRDDDGYGHYLGDEYEIWFNLQHGSDYDHDGIPFWAEVNILGTDPSFSDLNSDPDNDGIPTSWEWKWGYDPNIWDDHLNLDPDIDGIENIEEYMMEKWFADPYQTDIYIEIDGMEKGKLRDWDHISFEETHQMLIERFSQHGINVYIDYGWPDGPINGGGELLDFIDVIDDTVGHHHNKFYVRNFADERKGIFRYVTVVNNAGFIVAGDYNAFDHILIDTSKRKTFVNRRAFTPRYQRVVLAKGILHEFGHSLGLMPYSFYGVDILPDQESRWPSLPEDVFQQYLEDYYSIMNYNYIFSEKKLFDYSDGSNDPVYDQNDWEYLYPPTFQFDAIAYEEAVPTIDKTFEDIEPVFKDPKVILDDWVFDENISKKYIDEFKELNFAYNTKCDYKIFIENITDSQDNKAIRIYAKPKIEPTYTRWSLIAEGNIDIDESNIKIYSYEKVYADTMKMISDK